MSRPRSRSPHYRRFPWDEPDFDPYKVVAELDGDQMDRRHHHHHHPRGAPEERWNYVREDMHPEDQRRCSPFQDDRQFGHQRHSNQEEFYRRRPSPQHDMLGYEERRLSPIHDGGEDGARRIGGFREAYPNFENRGRSPNSPPRFKRERLPLTPRSDSDHQQREPGIGWRREGQGRGRGRFRDPSPSARSDDQRGGTGRERGRRNTQSLNRERQWEDPHQERNPHFKRQRREMDDTNNSGYRNEEHFGEQRHSMDSPRDGFQRERQGNLPRGDGRHSGPLIIEHDHGITDRREPSQWEKFEDRRDLDPGLDRQRSPCPTGFSQERFRASESRLEDRDTRPHFFQDNRRDSSYHGSARTPEKRPSPVNYGSRDSTMNHRGRGAFRPARGRASRGQFGRTGLPRNQPHLQHSFQADQDNRKEGPRQRSQPFRGDYEDPIKEPNWAEEDGPPGWKADRSGSLDRSPVTIDLDPKMPRQRLREWNKQKTKNMAVAEETLTIKVDMSQPVNKNSLLCYSSDRQLSLDLVNVGRQRLDFLPMLEHSGTYRETAVHTGTFAQEIITLVHSVKELYFRGDGVTLNERFSAPQKGGYLEEETEELTLDERFSSNRGFSLNMNSLLDDNEPLFSRLGSLPPARGPGDLRHDLERRRQERLEGVKVTILGNNLSQGLQGPISEPGAEYNDDEDQLEDEEFLDWPEEQSRSREGNMGTRRGAPFRQNNGPQRKNNRFGSRLGQIRRQNYRNSPAGPSW